MTRKSSAAKKPKPVDLRPTNSKPVDAAIMDERDNYDLMRSIAAGALSGGLTFVRAKMGEDEFVRSLAKVRLSEPIARLIGPADATNDERARPVEAASAPIAVMRPSTPVAAPGRPAEPSKYLDEKQLCAELSISSVTATKWRRNAEGPAFVRVGRLIRYPRAAVEAWLASRTVGVPRAQ